MQQQIGIERQGGGCPRTAPVEGWVVSARTIDLMLLTLEALRQQVAAADQPKKDVDTVHGTC